MPMRYDAQAPINATASTPNDASVTASPSLSTARITDDTSWATTHAPRNVTTAVDASIGRGAADGRNPPENPNSVRARSCAEPATTDDATRPHRHRTRAVR